MLGGARRPPPPNYLRIAVKLLNQYIRLAKRQAREDPDHFDYATVERNYLEALRQREARLAFEAAALRIYGPEPANA